MSIILEMGWVIGTFFVGGIIASLAITITAAVEIMRIIKYAVLKTAVAIAHWCKLRNKYIEDLTDFVHRVAESDANSASKFREWEFTQWKKEKKS